SRIQRRPCAGGDAAAFRSGGHCDRSCQPCRSCVGTGGGAGRGKGCGSGAAVRCGGADGVESPTAETPSAPKKPWGLLLARSGLFPDKSQTVRLEAKSQELRANSQQLTTNDERPTTNDQRPTTNDQQPTTNDQRPTTAPPAKLTRNYV